MRTRNGLIGIAATTMSLVAGQALACEACENAGIESAGMDYRVVDVNGCRAATPEEIPLLQTLLLNGDAADNNFDIPRDRVLASVNAANGARSNFDIQYALSPAVAADPDFPAALELAAQLWESVIQDTATVVIDVDFTSNQGFLAAAGSSRATIPYANLVGALQNDASPAESTYINTLPGTLEFDYGFNVFNTDDTYTFGQLIIRNPVSTFQGLGFGDVNGSDVESSIVFNTDFTWDPDPFDGFQGQASIYFVMVHEIGHAIGFVSGTDGSNFPSILDVYRVGALGSTENPSSLPELATVQRQMAEGTEAQLDPLGQFPGFNAELRFSTGVNGDGRQASHWKDQSALGASTVIGVMDPTFEGGAGIDLTDPLSENDFLAFSLIGWDIDIPGTQIDPPGAFGLVSPADGAADVSAPPTFLWQVSSDADDYTLTVTENGSGTATIDITTAGTSFTPAASTLLPGVTYTWVVVANNVAGNTTATGGSDTFTMADVPGDFNQLSPADGATDVSETPTFDWSDAAGADSYTVRVFPEGSSTAAIDQTVVPSTFTPAPGVLQPGTTYRWIIIATNAVGTNPATGGLDFFTTAAPAPDCPDSTGDGSVDTADLLEVLANFNSVVAGGPADGDFDNSGTVDTADLLAVLAVFNTACP